MQTLSGITGSIVSVTPAGWSLLGGSIFAAAALLCLNLTHYKKGEVALAKRALSSIEIDDDGKLTSINNHSPPTTLEGYRWELATISAPRRPERTALLFLTSELDLGIAHSRWADRSLQEGLSTMREGKQTSLGFMLKQLRKVEASDFAKRVDAAAKPGATRREKLSPYREELVCGAAALCFYAAMSYFIGIKKQLFFEI